MNFAKDRTRKTDRGSRYYLVLYVLILGLCFVAYATFASGSEDGNGGMLGGSLWAILNRGGAVMYVILAFSAIGLGFILDAAYISRRAVILPAETQDRLERGVTAGELGELVERGGDARIDRVLAAGYRWRNEAHDQIATAIEEIVDETVWQMQRSVRPIGIIANTAPLLGLLGTVAGIIEAFNEVAAHGALGDPGALAGGISKALLTTCFGLIVAIPMLLVYHYLTGRVEMLVRRCEILAKQVLITPSDS